MISRFPPSGSRRMLSRATTARFGLPQRRPEGITCIATSIAGLRKIMDHILGSHGEFYGDAHGYVKFVDVTPSIRILDLPHPLLSHHEDFGRCSRWKPVANEKHGAPHEHHNAESGGN